VSDDEDALIDGNVLLGMKHSGLFYLGANEALAKLKEFKAERERMREINQ
jgi:hypothetical protein